MEAVTDPRPGHAYGDRTYESLAELLAHYRAFSDRHGHTSWEFWSARLDKPCRDPMTLSAYLRVASDMLRIFNTGDLRSTAISAAILACYHAEDFLAESGVIVTAGRAAENAASLEAAGRPRRPSLPADAALDPNPDSDHGPPEERP